MCRPLPMLLPMLRALFSALSGVFSFLNIWKQGKERDKDRQSGEDRAVVRHLEGDIEASKEMRGIEDETRRLAPNARRSALRRFMSNDNDEDGDDR